MKKYITIENFGKISAIAGIIFSIYLFLNGYFMKCPSYNEDPEGLCGLFKYIQIFFGFYYLIISISEIFIAKSAKLGKTARTILLMLGVLALLIPYFVYLSIFVL